jgi:sigma-B regulation protein RsbU (phosphoserine phosphatase)
MLSGAVFVFVGLTACCIAAMGRRGGVRVVVWLGVWSVMYGTRPLVDPLAVALHWPHWFQVSLPYLDTAVSYLILVVATLAFLELTTGKVRLFLQAAVCVGLAIAVAGIGIFVFTGSDDKLILYNQLLATCTLLVLVALVALRGLAHKFLVLPNRGVLAMGMFFFAAEALFTNLARPLGYRPPAMLDTLGFAALLFSLGYAAMQMMLANERRLLSIEEELAIARRIQTSILPGANPECGSLRIAAAYRPMTAVAGDFYEFLPGDANRLGFFVADVSGHGVPAALIAAMIKVALQSAASCASDPPEVLRRLNRILFGQLRGMLISAGYLWMDTEKGEALYSAAGHPPLLRWRGGRLERIESNGLVMGVMPEPDYPVCPIPIEPGDRFLLYTDGLVEPENAAGEAFGEGRLEEVLRSSQSRGPSELVEELLSALGRWQPSSLAQQDDITLIVLDVVQSGTRTNVPLPRVLQEPGKL